MEIILCAKQKRPSECARMRIAYCSVLVLVSDDDDDDDDDVADCDRSSLFSVMANG